MSEIEAAGNPTKSLTVFLSCANAEVNGTLSAKGVASNLSPKRRKFTLLMTVCSHFYFIRDITSNDHGFRYISLAATVKSC